jgi:hypothetical protein
VAIKKTDNRIQVIQPTPLVLTTSYQDIGNFNAGPYIDFKDCLSIALWLKIDINDSTGLLIRMQVTDSDVGSPVVYDIPIKEVTATQVKVTPNVVSIVNNIDQNIMLSFPVSDQIPVGKFQIKATVAGATPGQLLSAGVTFTVQGL